MADEQYRDDDLEIDETRQTLLSISKSLKTFQKKNQKQYNNLYTLMSRMSNSTEKAFTPYRKPLPLDRTLREIQKDSKIKSKEYKKEGSISTSKLNSSIKLLSVTLEKSSLSILRGTKDFVVSVSKEMKNIVDFDSSTFVGRMFASSPVIGYFASKLFESNAFQNLMEGMKENISSGFVKSMRFMASKTPLGKKDEVDKIPKMQKGGIVKKGGLVELHEGEVVAPYEKLEKTLQKGRMIDGEKIVEANKQVATETKKGMDNISNKLVFSMKNASSDILTGFSEHSYSLIQNLKEEFGKVEGTREELSYKAIVDLRNTLAGELTAFRRLQLAFRRTLFENPLIRGIYDFYNISKSIFTGITRFTFRRRNKYASELPRSADKFSNMVQILAILYTGTMFRLDRVVHYLTALTKGLVDKNIKGPDEKTWSVSSLAWGGVKKTGISLKDVASKLYNDGFKKSLIDAREKVEEKTKETISSVPILKHALPKAWRKKEEEKKMGIVPTALQQLAGDFTGIRSNIESTTINTGITVKHLSDYIIPLLKRIQECICNTSGILEYWLPELSYQTNTPQIEHRGIIPQLETSRKNVLLLTHEKTPTEQITETIKETAEKAEIKTSGVIDIIEKTNEGNEKQINLLNKLINIFKKTSVNDSEDSQKQRSLLSRLTEKLSDMSHWVRKKVGGFLHYLMVGFLFLKGFITGGFGLFKGAGMAISGLVWAAIGSSILGIGKLLKSSIKWLGTTIFKKIKDLFKVFSKPAALAVPAAAAAGVAGATGMGAGAAAAGVGGAAAAGGVAGKLTKAEKFKKVISKVSKSPTGKKWLMPLSVLAGLGIFSSQKITGKEVIPDKKIADSLDTAQSVAGTAKLSEWGVKGGKRLIKGKNVAQAATPVAKPLGALGKVGKVAKTAGKGTLKTLGRLVTPLWLGVDAYKGAAKKDEYGTSRFSSGMGGLLAGHEEGTGWKIFDGLMKGGFTGAIAGGAAGLGVGAIPGAIAGALAGVGLALIGPEKIAKGFDSVGRGIKKILPFSKKEKDISEKVKDVKEGKIRKQQEKVEISEKIKDIPKEKEVVKDKKWFAGVIPISQKEIEKESKPWGYKILDGLWWVIKTALNIVWWPIKNFLLKPAWWAIKKLASGLWGTVKWAGGKIKDAFFDKTSTKKSLPEGLSDSISGKVKNLDDYRNNKTSETLSKEIPKLQEGGFVKKGGIVHIHKGEVVAPYEKIEETLNKVRGIDVQQLMKSNEKIIIELRKNGDKISDSVFYSGRSNVRSLEDLKEEFAARYKEENKKGVWDTIKSGFGKLFGKEDKGSQTNTERLLRGDNNKIPLVKQPQIDNLPNKKIQKAMKDPISSYGDERLVHDYMRTKTPWTYEFMDPYAFSYWKRFKLWTKKQYYDTKRWGHNLLYDDHRKDTLGGQIRNPNAQFTNTDKMLRGDNSNVIPLVKQHQLDKTGRSARDAMNQSELNRVKQPSTPIVKYGDTNWFRDFMRAKAPGLENLMYGKPWKTRLRHFKDDIFYGAKRWGHNLLYDDHREDILGGQIVNPNARAFTEGNRNNNTRTFTEGNRNNKVRESYNKTDEMREALKSESIIKFEEYKKLTDALKENIDEMTDSLKSSNLVNANLTQSTLNSMTNIIMNGNQNGMGGGMSAAGGGGGFTGLESIIKGDL